MFVNHLSSRGSKTQTDHCIALLTGQGSLLHMTTTFDTPCKINTFGGSEILKNIGTPTPWSLSFPMYLSVSLSFLSWIMYAKNVRLASFLQQAFQMNNCNLYQQLLRFWGSLISLRKFHKRFSMWSLFVEFISVIFYVSPGRKCLVAEVAWNWYFF